MQQSIQPSFFKFVWRIKVPLATEKIGQSRVTGLGRLNLIDWRSDLVVATSACKCHPRMRCVREELEPAFPSFERPVQSVHRKAPRNIDQYQKAAIEQLGKQENLFSSGKACFCLKL